MDEKELRKREEALLSNEKQLKAIEADLKRQYDNMLSEVKAKCASDLSSIQTRDAAVKNREDACAKSEARSQVFFAESQAKFSEAEKKEKSVLEVSSENQRKSLSISNQERALENRKLLFEADLVAEKASFEERIKAFNDHRGRVEKSLSEERKRLADLATDLEKRIKEVIEDRRKYEGLVLEAEELKKRTDEHVVREMGLIAKRKSDLEKAESSLNEMGKEVAFREKKASESELSLVEREKAVLSKADHNEKWSANLELKERELKILKLQVERLIQVNSLEKELGIKK